jgi:peroxiredoxin
MKSIGLVFLAVFVIGGQAVQATPGAKSVTHETYGKLKVGAVIPSFNSFINPVDSNWNLKQVIRKNDEKKEAAGFVLAFFRTDCPPCIKGLENLKQNADKFKAKKIKPILINYNEKPDVFQVWVTERQYYKYFTIAYDKYGYSGPEYGIKSDPSNTASTASLPLTVVIDGAGTITKIITEEGPDYIDLIVNSIKG